MSENLSWLDVWWGDLLLCSRGKRRIVSSVVKDSLVIEAS